MASVFFRRRLVCLRDVSRVVIRLALIGASVVWAVLLSSVAWSQECTGYLLSYDYVNGPVVFRGTPQWYPDSSTASRNAACEAWISEWGLAYAQQRWEDSGSTTYTGHGAEKFGTSPCSVRAFAQRLTPSPGDVQTTISLFLVQVAGQCPPEEECDTVTPGLGVGESFTSLIPPSAGGDYCNAVSKCLMRVNRSITVSGETIWTVTHTDENCTPGAPKTDDDEFKRETCVTTASGNEYCASKDGKNCGWLNGEFVCVPSVERDGCAVFSDGGRLCGPDAPTPPVPDDGTSGNPAEPDETFESVDDAGNQTTYNYYNNTTVSNSYRPPGSSGDNPYDGEDDGSGTGGGGAGSRGDGEGLMCDPETDAACNGDGEAGEAEDVREGWQCWAEGDGFAASVAGCFQTATQALWDGLVNDASVLSIASETAAAWPAGGGSCPSDVVHIAWLNESFDVWEVPCEFFADAEAVLGPLFLLMWSLLGLRILLTIPGGGE